jgi:hypothetical protein
MPQLGFSLSIMVLLACLVIPSAGQQKQDTVYQKDGEIIAGSIIEDNPGFPEANLKIRVSPHSVWVLYYSNIAKIEGATQGGQSASDNLKKMKE